MSGKDGIPTLEEHRALLLACEVIGCLHMAGKANPDFLRKHGDQDVNYHFKDWHLSFNLANYFSWIIHINKFIKLPDDIADLFNQFDEKKSKESIVGLLQAAHAMASGIEKNHPNSTTAYLGQDTTHMWLTTAFGHPVRNLLENPPEVLLKDSWETLLDKISSLFEELRKLGTNQETSTAENWFSWRDNAIGKNGWLRKAFSETLAETRIPNNDVTLWDQSYVAAALFKSAVAGMILSGSNNWNGLKQNTQWRVMTVGIGASHWEERAVRIGDWTGARQEIDTFFDAVCRYIEIDLAVGSLLYRDDEVLSFSFPVFCLDKKNGLLDEEAKKLKDDIEHKIDDIAKGHKLEMPPIVRLSSSTRSMISMAGEIDYARMKLQVPIHRTWQVPEENETDGHICPVCQIRLNGSHNKQYVCKVCGDRRTGRFDYWNNDKLDGDTIWISEVADHNDRLALLTLNLDLSGWLDGSQVDSLRAQSVVEWIRHNSVLDVKAANPINQEQPNQSLIEYVQDKLGSFDNKDPVLLSLQAGYKHAGNWKTFFNLMVEDRSDAQSWNKLDDDERAHWLAHQFFRKNASPGRVRRFWETTQNFFDELLGDFRSIVSRDANQWRVRRLVLYPNEVNWKGGETYHGSWSGEFDKAQPIELVYDKKQECLFTICNIARILSTTDSVDTLRGKNIEVENDSVGMHTLTIAEAKDAPSPLGIYNPLIVLDKSPMRFRVLLPLSQADDCIQHAINKWEIEFARVWDRIPLKVGVVGFPRKLPYQAVVEAARNMEDKLSEQSSQEWQIQHAQTLYGVTALSMICEDDYEQIVTVPTTLPDGRLLDVYYPYCAVADGQLREPHDFDVPRLDKGKHHEHVIYRWMSDLHPGDKIKVMPSRIARVFLDSTSWRFDPVKVDYFEDFKFARYIWRIIQEIEPSVTAVRAAEAIIREKKDNWSNINTTNTIVAEETWLEFVRATLANLWLAKGARLNILVDAARNGILMETMSWHLHVLKQKIESENE